MAFIEWTNKVPEKDGVYTIRRYMSSLGKWSALPEVASVRIHRGYVWVYAIGDSDPWVFSEEGLSVSETIEFGPCIELPCIVSLPGQVS